MTHSVECTSAAFYPQCVEDQVQAGGEPVVFREWLLYIGLDPLIEVFTNTNHYVYGS